MGLEAALKGGLFFIAAVDRRTKKGRVVAASYLCPMCQKDVYVSEGEREECPVCSTPLVGRVEETPTAS